MAHITLSQLRTVLGRIVTWATSKFAARNATSGKLEYADMPVVVLASMGAELDGTGTDRPMSPGSTYFLPAGGGVGARIMFMDSQGVPAKISDPVSSVIYCNAYTGLLYRWDTAQAKMIPVGGTSGGSIDVSGKADLLAGTGMLTPSQWPKVVLRNVTNTMLDDLASGDVFFDTGNLFLHIDDNQGDVSLGPPSKKIIYYCLADHKLYRWTGNSFEVVNDIVNDLVTGGTTKSLSAEQGKLLRLKTTVVIDEIKANASYDSLPSGKTEYIYYRAGDSKLVRMYISGGSTVTEVYDPDPRVAYFNKDKGKFMYYFNGQFRNALAIDDEPTEDSSNPVSSGGVYDALAAKQDTLVAGNGIVIAQDGKTVSVAEAIRTGAAAGATALQPSDVSVETPVTPDGTVDINVGSNTYTIDLNHTHENMAKLIVCEESDLPSTLDEDTIYGVNEDGEISMLYVGGIPFYGGGDGGTSTPVLRQPADGSTIDVGAIASGESSVTKTITVKGKNLTQALTVAVTDTGYSVNKQSIPAADANVGTTLTITCTNTDENAEGTLSIGSSEVANDCDLVANAVTYETLRGVKFTGSQWVETDYYPNTNTEFEMDLKLTANANTPATPSDCGIAIMRSFYETSNDERFTVHVGRSSSSSPYGAYQLFFMNKAGSANQKSIDFSSLRSEFVADHAKLSYVKGTSAGTFKFNGGTERSVTTALADVNMPTKLDIGYNPIVSQIFAAFDLTIYEFTITEDGSVVRHWVPKLKNGTIPGLYDTVTGKFISSETSTELVAVN